ncbi:MAG: hypothetical protein VW879_16770, partial [Opitutae bacterium]
FHPRKYTAITQNANHRRVRQTLPHVVISGGASSHNLTNQRLQNHFNIRDSSGRDHINWASFSSGLTGKCWFIKITPTRGAVKKLPYTHSLNHRGHGPPGRSQVDRLRGGLPRVSQ